MQFFFSVAADIGWANFHGYAEMHCRGVPLGFLLALSVFLLITACIIIDH
jgi:hypothetical protein